MNEMRRDGDSHPAQRTLAAYSNKTAERVNNSKDEERRERIAKAEGDPDDTVFYKVNTTKSPAAYHEERECKYLVQDDRNRVGDGTREIAERRGRMPCKRCVDGLSEQTNEGEMKQDCPLCDETVRSIRNHLPCDGVTPLDGGETA